MKTGKYDYTFNEDWGPFGKCRTTVDYDVDEHDNVTVTGGSFYYNGRIIDFDREAALNTAGCEIEDFCLTDLENYLRDEADEQAYRSWVQREIDG